MKAPVQAPIAPARCGSAGAHAPGRCSHSPHTINPIIAGNHFSLGGTPFLLTVIYLHKNDE
jgi:hypothetical protein